MSIEPAVCEAGLLHQVRNTDAAKAAFSIALCGSCNDLLLMLCHHLFAYLHRQVPSAYGASVFWTTIKFMSPIDDTRHHNLAVCRYPPGAHLSLQGAKVCVHGYV